MKKARDGRRRIGERHAQLPVWLLETDAVTTLPHAAFRVLVLMCAEFNGTNNGALALTESRFRERYGKGPMRGRSTLYGALDELQTRGLIVETRMGLRQRNSFSLFALAWREATHWGGKVLDMPRPADIAQILKYQAKTTERRHTPRRTRQGVLVWNGSEYVPANGTQAARDEKSFDRPAVHAVPTSGTEQPKSVPIDDAKSGSIVPTSGNTSRFRTAPHRDPEVTGGPSAPATPNPTITAKQKASLAQPEAPATASGGVR